MKLWKYCLSLWEAVTVAPHAADDKNGDNIILMMNTVVAVATVAADDNEWGQHGDNEH